MFLQRPPEGGKFAYDNQCNGDGGGFIASIPVVGCMDGQASSSTASSASSMAAGSSATNKTSKADNSVSNKIQLGVGMDVRVGIGLPRFVYAGMMIIKCCASWEIGNE